MRAPQAQTTPQPTWRSFFLAWSHGASGEDRFADGGFFASRRGRCLLAIPARLLRRVRESLLVREKLLLDPLLALLA